MKTELSLHEIEALIPLAMDALKQEISAPRTPPNPAKAAEYCEREAQRFNRKRDRLNELLNGWLSIKIQAISP